MSALAQRIITSHKEAAKRAVAHLGKTRKLKLSATESLELVACILGVANWQTLQAQAKDGRGPRIDDGKPAPKQATTAEESIAGRLRDYYETPSGGWGEHPEISLEDWQSEIENDNTRLGYWEHVEAECDRLGRMLPWDRDAMFDYKLAQVAGLDVEWDSEGEDENDWLITDPWGYVFAPNCSTEKAAWQEAASAILRYVSDKLSMRAADFERITEADWLAATARVHAPLLASVRSSKALPSDELDNGYSLLPGEMTKDSRKFSEDITLCRELSIKAEYSDEKENEGLYWTTDEKNFFATEAEAWKGEVDRLRTEVANAVGVAPVVWDTTYDLDTKIKLAKRFCHLPFA